MCLLTKPSNAARAMIRQVCNIKSEDVAKVRSMDILAKTCELENLDLILRERRLHSFGHIELSSGAVLTVCNKLVDERCGPGRPKIIWKKLIEDYALSRSAPQSTSKSRGQKFHSSARNCK